MDLELTLNETRGLGSLIEKEATTPDQYPLSLNALINACNQKSNREPVLALSEAVVQAILEQLTAKRLVIEKTGFGSRVPKYQHRFGNTEFSEHCFDRGELALLCVLFLRGAQTPGELRSRSRRLHEFGDGGEVDDALRRLMERADGPFVAKLPREPGRRESRYVHLFTAEPTPSVAEETIAVGIRPAEEGGRFGVLERRVDELAEELECLKRRLTELEDTGSL